MNDIVIKFLHNLFSFINNEEYSNSITILCALIGLVGTWLTIKYTYNQFKKDKMISVKPYLNISVKNQKYFDSKEKAIKEAIYRKRESVDPSSESNEILILKDNIGIESLIRMCLCIENIGLGHAVDFKILKITRNSKEINCKNSLSKIKINNLQTEKRIDLKIYIEFKDFSKDIELIEEKYANLNPAEVLNKSVFLLDSFNKDLKKLGEEICIMLKYNDILKNSYTGKIYLKTKMSATTIDPINKFSNIVITVLFDRFEEKSIK